MTVSYQHQCVTELQGSSGPLAHGLYEYNDASGLQTYALLRALGRILFLKTMLSVLSF